MVKDGDKVKVHYTGTLEDGTVFDSSEGKEPLEIEVGKGMVISGFEDAIKGMKQGEEKEVKIPKDKAYGEYKKEMLKKVPRDQLPSDQEPKEGMVLLAQLPTGQKLPIKIVSVEGKEVTLDMNHPLAGKDLTFKIKIDSVEEGEAEKAEKKPEDTTEAKDAK